MSILGGAVVGEGTIKNNNYLVVYQLVTGKGRKETYINNHESKLTSYYFFFAKSKSEMTDASRDDHHFPPLSFFASQTLVSPVSKSP